MEKLFSSVSAAKNVRVNVIGAGVIGLTFGLILQRKGYQVKIMAEHFPGDHNINYTSPWAGADWRAINLNAREQKFLGDSFKYLWDLVETPDTGIIRLPLYDYIEKSYSDDNTWLEDLVPNFKIIPKDELPPNTGFGTSYTTVTIDVVKYLPWLLNQFVDVGGKYEKRHLANINEAMEDDVDVVVNCTGIMARYFGGVEDSNVYPIRGQIVTAWAPHIKKAIHHQDKDSVTYIIPRENGVVILGGTLDENDYTEAPNPRVAEEIIKRCIKICPELTSGKGAESLEIKRHAVGLRPARKGNIRLEVEMRKNPNDKDVIVCHNYGHSSYVGDHV
nr:7308_t:CDS:2 [Entrophospora candida]